MMVFCPVTQAGLKLPSSSNPSALASSSAGIAEKHGRGREMQKKKRKHSSSSSKFLPHRNVDDKYGPLMAPISSSSSVPTTGGCHRLEHTKHTVCFVISDVGCQIR
ncbi:hypothetical protein AAY473_010981 [Plecturocebus cupreus]